MLATTSGFRTPSWALERIKAAAVDHVETLDLSRSSFKDEREALVEIPPEVFQFSKLRCLNLSHNQLGALPESLAQLQSLTKLELNGNQFSAFPEAITRLQDLKVLSLGKNQLSTVPKSITQLQNLTVLYLNGNQLSTFPEAITRLPNLKTLVLNDNQLGSLPESITRLQSLRELALYQNQLSIVPESITQLRNLKQLYLGGNRLKILPQWITGLPNLNLLNVEGNPLVTPPIEIANGGMKAIRQYFEQLDQHGEEYIYEAKLLILGEGGAGKTTFANKLMNINYALKEEKSTKGVNVLRWSFPMDGNRQFRVNIWDFGGQEIYHATHQFFLTRRSLYTLVADTRKDNTDFYYWLNIAELFSDGSPLLIVKNEKEDRPCNIPEPQLRGEFKSLKEVVATNFATNRGVQEVKEEVEHYIKKLPHIGSPLPRTWARVREQLEKDPRNYISLDEYVSICKENGFADTKDALQLSSYLHDIGVFLHFQDEPMLKKTVILEPKWGTDAVYQVLDNQTVTQNLGQFTREDLEAIWDEPEYEPMRDQLLELMIKFKLCYEMPSQRGTYIAPQLLTENKPDYPWDDRGNLLLRFSYEFMPRGILTQFIVAMHPYIWKQTNVWKSGVVIVKDRTQAERLEKKDKTQPKVDEKEQAARAKIAEKESTRAEIVEYYEKNEIQVRVIGSQARELMSRIEYEFEQIHDKYNRLKYAELIRCNCSTCKDSQEPHFFPVATLKEFLADKQLEIQCQKKPYQMVNVLKLLGDTFDLLERKKKPGADVIYNIHGDFHNYEEGDNRMTEINQHIEGSTIHGSVVAAESIKDSFNTIEKSNAQEDLKEQLKQLAQAVDAMAKELPQDKAEEVADDMKRLAEEATKEKPNQKWYSVSIDGLVKAAENLGQVGEPVIKLAGKVVALLAVP